MQPTIYFAAQVVFSKSPIQIPSQIIWMDNQFNAFNQWETKVQSSIW